MRVIVRYLAYLAAAVVLGVWLTLTFTVRLSAMLAPALGDAAIVVVLLLLSVAPALLLALLKRRLS